MQKIDKHSYDIEIGLGLLVRCLKDTVQTDKL